MRKIGGIILLSALALTACSAPATTTEAAPSASSSESASTKIAPLLAAPSPSAILPPEFNDDSARARYLAGVKKSPNAWRDGDLPSDETLLEAAAQACQLFGQGKTAMEIGGLAGDTDIKRTNGVAVAVYASLYFCKQYYTGTL